MAGRTYGRILTSIWGDADFVTMPSASQHMFVALVTQPRLSYAGVLDYFPRRLATLAPDLTTAKVERSLRILAERRFIMIDEETVELLVRTYVRHDNLMHHKNVGKAFVTAFRKIQSVPLQEAVIVELQKLYTDTAGQQGWAGVAEASPEVFALAQGLAQAVGQ